MWYLFWYVNIDALTPDVLIPDARIPDALEFHFIAGLLAIVFLFLFKSGNSVL